MKKISAAVLILALCFSLASCAQSHTSTGSASPSPGTASGGGGGGLPWFGAAASGSATSGEEAASSGASSAASSGAAPKPAASSAPIKLGDVSANLYVNQQGGRMCEAGGYVFYVWDGGKQIDPYAYRGGSPSAYLCRASADGSGRVALSSAHFYMYNLMADEKYLYFLEVDGDHSSWCRYPLKGGAIEAFPALDAVDDAVVANGRFYWITYGAEDNDTSIGSMNPDGSGKKTLLSKLSGAYTLQVTASKIYFGASEEIAGVYASYLYSADLTGKNLKKLPDSKGFIGGNADGDYFYAFIDKTLADASSPSASLARYGADGNAVTVLPDAPCQFIEGGTGTAPGGISGGSYYYIDYNYDVEKCVLKKIDLATKAVTELKSFPYSDDNYYALRTPSASQLKSTLCYGFYFIGGTIFFADYPGEG